MSAFSAWSKWIDWSALSAPIVRNAPIVPIATVAIAVRATTAEGIVDQIVELTASWTAVGSVPIAADPIAADPIAADPIGGTVRAAPMIGIFDATAVGAGTASDVVAHREVAELEVAVSARRIRTPTVDLIVRHRS